MKVAALQMVSAPDLQTNLQIARALLQQASAAGAELAALPEYFCAMGLRDSDKLGLRETFGQGPIQDFLAHCAREFGLWIVGGTLPLQTDDVERVRNSTLVFSPSGDCVARYDKIHLFHYDNGQERYDEAQVIEAGQSPVLLDVCDRSGALWRLGLSICYDLRFPELYRALAQQDCDLLLVPSAFTHTTGQAHWEILLRARAIENQAYVLAPAQGGLHPNGRRTWGHSMLVDPWGQILAEVDQGPGLALAQVDHAQLARVRAQLPAQQHRIL